MDHDSSQPVIVGLGEALVDVFPDGEFIGGAPMNVAVHARQLGNAGVVVSRVGRDERGDRILAELAACGLDTATVQIDQEMPTGTVAVRFNEQGEPEYEIVADVAWDALRYDDNLHGIALETHAVCFGTLAQRHEQSRGAIYRFLEAAQSAIRLFDVNLRQDAYTAEILTTSFQYADAAKFNIDELGELVRLFELAGESDRAISRLIAMFNLRWVALTRGAAGTAVFTARHKHDAEPVAASASIGDAVGAGDATSAALLHGAVRSWPWDRTLTLANQLGAHVASQPGACPPLTDTIRALAGGTA